MIGQSNDMKLPPPPRRITILDSSHARQKISTTRDPTSICLQLLRAATANKRKNGPPLSSSLRCFPIRAHEIHEPPSTPTAFHRLLINKIQNSKTRIQLASLYVGTASSNDEKASTEREFLDALRLAAKNGVLIQILLDANRALRPVAFSHSQRQSGYPTSNNSAQACASALSSPPPTSQGRRKLDEGDKGCKTACFDSSNGDDAGDFDSGVYLFSVIPPSLQRLLPNPLNEISGVFHIKAYIIDNELILSGANLSYEYFTTRVDRYLHVTQPDLVDFYSHLVFILCAYGSSRYNYGSTTESHYRDFISSIFDTSNDVLQQRMKLQAELEKLFTVAAHEDPIRDSNTGFTVSDTPNNIVAYAVPTFQAPKGFFSSYLGFNDHETVMENLLRASSNIPLHASACQPEIESHHLHPLHDYPRHRLTARIATAYLNPTRTFQSLLAMYVPRSYFLTAGRISHGFAPKQSTTGKLCSSANASSVANENRSHNWNIPNIFSYAALQVVDTIHRLRLSGSTPSNSQRSLCLSSEQRSQPDKERGDDISFQVSLKEPSASVAFYQRPGWTFHAKGFWLSIDNISDQPRFDFDKAASNRLIAVIVGSGNFGERSSVRDMESNLLLIPTKNLASKLFTRQFMIEWNDYCDFACHEEPCTPPLWIRIAFPFIRSYF